MFSFPCERCGSMLSGDEDTSGTTGRCPTCGAEVSVPRIDPRTGIPDLARRPTPYAPLEGPLHAYAAAGAQAPGIVQSESGEPLIACPHCGQHSDVSADRCRHCRHPFTLDGLSAVAGKAFERDQWLTIVLGIVALLTIWCVVGVIPALLGVYLGADAIRRARALPATPTLWGCYLGIVLSIGALVAGMAFLLR